MLNSSLNSVVGLCSTFAGSRGYSSSAGYGYCNYAPNEIPANVFDSNLNTKYTSFGSCYNDYMDSGSSCGLNTGLHFTIEPNPVLLTAFRFATANDVPERDPMTITIEGSNATGSDLFLGSSWSLIYNGSTGLGSTTARFTFGTMQQVSNNGARYSSYRFLATSKRSNSNTVQYSTLELYGYYF